MIEPGSWTFESRNIEGFETTNEVVFEYPARYGGTGSDVKPESSGEHDQTMAAFGIKTGQNAAQKVMESLPTTNVTTPREIPQQQSKAIDLSAFQKAPEPQAAQTDFFA